MRPLLDWLATHVEPYVSFRFLIALVFTGLFVNGLVATALLLRDAMQSRPASSPRDQQLVRIAKSYGLLLLLRLVSWRTVKRHRALVAQIALLFLLSIALSIGVFHRGLLHWLLS
jgi:hypothetical protein